MTVRAATGRRAAQRAWLLPLCEATPAQLDALLRSQRAGLTERFGELVARGVDRLREPDALRAVAGALVCRDGAARAYAAVTECGSAHVLGTFWDVGNRDDDAALLLSQLIANAGASGRSLEAQDLGFGDRDLTAVLERYARSQWSRCWMDVGLALVAPPRPAPRGVSIRPWRQSDFLGTADVAFRAFGGTLDSELSASYGSLTGCLARVLAIVEGQAWGPRCETASLVAVDHGGGLAGYALVTRIGSRRAHLVETAVRPELEGRGIGRALLSSALRAAADDGLGSVTLSVTESNERARELYRGYGFETRRRFHAYRFGDRQE